MSITTAMRAAEAHEDTESLPIDLNLTTILVSHHHHVQARIQNLNIQAGQE